ncbi:MAG: cupin domain-containing protein [Paracoccaceae bacterium]|nr:cupin domain-containing protein [Paracoccaceae bacterium]
MMITVLCGGIGLTIGALGGHGLAQVAPATENKGLSVELLARITPELIQRAVGLEGRHLMVRHLTVEPGGTIRKHDHVGRPGLVAITRGELVDGRPDGEKTYGVGTAIIEDEDTVHWLFNRTDEPAEAILCDLRPPKT